MPLIGRSFSFDHRKRKPPPPAVSSAPAPPPLTNNDVSTQSEPPLRAGAIGAAGVRVRRALSFGSARQRKGVGGGPSTNAPSEEPPIAFAKEVALFNESDKGAREALKALHLAGESRRWQAATFLHRTPGLDMAVLGELLGRPDFQPLMQAYVRKLDFSGLNLEKALRALLAGFRLPGEAQKIDRILEAFARHWHDTSGMAGTADASGGDSGGTSSGDAQPRVSSDTAYLISFALIMLNTDLHNPAIKKARKMTLQGFTNNLRGQGPGGTDLPAGWLRQLYDGISRDEIKLKGDAKTNGASAAIVPGLSLEGLRRVQGRARAAALLVLAVVRMQRLAAARRAAAVSRMPEVIALEMAPSPASASGVRRNLAKLLSPRGAGRQAREASGGVLMRHTPPSGARHRRSFSTGSERSPAQPTPLSSSTTPSSRLSGGDVDAPVPARHSIGDPGGSPSHLFSLSMPLGWKDMMGKGGRHHRAESWSAGFATSTPRNPLHLNSSSPLAPASAPRSAGAMRLMRKGSEWRRRPRKARRGAAGATATSPPSARMC